MSPTSIDPRKLALASFLGIAADAVEDEIEEVRYTDNAFAAERKEFLVLTDEEADTAAQEAVSEGIWALNTSFLSRYVPELSKRSVEAAWEKMVGELCEDAAPLARRLLGRWLNEALREAVNEDGRGYFLASYDAEEAEVVIDNAGTFYIYRTS